MSTRAEYQTSILFEDWPCVQSIEYRKHCKWHLYSVFQVYRLWWQSLPSMVPPAHQEWWPFKYRNRHWMFCQILLILNKSDISWFKLSQSVNSWMCPQVLQSCGSPELVRSVISPHLSKDAVDFLRGHLTPKEMTIFELLGDGWTKPRYINWCFYTALLSTVLLQFAPHSPIHTLSYHARCYSDHLRQLDT